MHLRATRQLLPAHPPAVPHIPQLHHALLPLLAAVVMETAVRGLSSPIGFVAAIACAIAGVLLRVTAAAGS